MCSKELGFTNVYVVPEQELPDGDFPTVSYPNPEAAEAFALGLALGKKVDADLILATDPDADRLGVYCEGCKDRRVCDIYRKYVRMPDWRLCDRTAQREPDCRRTAHLSVRSYPRIWQMRLRHTTE